MQPHTIMQLLASAAALALCLASGSSAQSLCMGSSDCPGNFVCTQGLCLETGGPSRPPSNPSPPPSNNPGNGGDCVREWGRCGSGSVGVGGGSCCNGLSCRNGQCQRNNNPPSGSCVANGNFVGNGNANRCCSRYTFNG